MEQRTVMKDEGSVHASTPTGSASSPQRRRVPRPGDRGRAAAHGLSAPHPRPAAAGDREGTPVQGDADPTLPRGLLWRRGCRVFPSTPGQHDAGHGTSSIRGVVESQYRRLRSWRHYWKDWLVGNQMNSLNGGLS